MNYQIIVGEDVIEETSSAQKAHVMFDEYVEMSKDGYGRIGHKDVYLFFNSKIIKEHEN
jgi:hypothetical protein